MKLSPNWRSTEDCDKTEDWRVGIKRDFFPRLSTNRDADWHLKIQTEPWQQLIMISSKSWVSLVHSFNCCGVTVSYLIIYNKCLSMSFLPPLRLSKEVSSVDNDSLISIIDWFYTSPASRLDENHVWSEATELRWRERQSPCQLRWRRTSCGRPPVCCELLP